MTKIILSGDLNCCLLSNDKIGGSPVSAKKSVINEIENLANSSNLIDLWWSQHPKEKIFTWRSTNKKVCCRLDYFLVSKCLVNSYSKSYIIFATVVPDHSATMGFLTSTHPWSVVRAFGSLITLYLLSRRENTRVCQQIPLFTRQRSLLGDG